MSLAVKRYVWVCLGVRFWGPYFFCYIQYFFRLLITLACIPLPMIPSLRTNSLLQMSAEQGYFSMVISQVFGSFCRIITFLWSRRNLPLRYRINETLQVNTDSVRLVYSEFTKLLGVVVTRGLDLQVMLKIYCRIQTCGLRCCVLRDLS